MVDKGELISIIGRFRNHIEAVARYADGWIFWEPKERKLWGYSERFGSMISLALPEEGIMTEIFGTRPSLFRSISKGGKLLLCIETPSSLDIGKELEGFSGEKEVAYNVSGYSGNAIIDSAKKKKKGRLTTRMLRPALYFRYERIYFYSTYVKLVSDESELYVRYRTGADSGESKIFD